MSRLFKKKKKTKIVRTVPPPTPEERALIAAAVRIAGLQAENIIKQSAFQDDFYERLVAELPPTEELEELRAQGKELEAGRLGLQFDEIAQTATDAEATSGLVQTQVDIVDELRADAAAQPQFSPEQQEEVNQQKLDTIREELDLQQQGVEQAAEEGTLTPDLFQSQTDSIKRLEEEVVRQLDLTEAQREEFGEIQKGLEDRLAELQKGELDQQIERQATEDEFLAEALEAVRSTGELSPEQEESIRTAVDQAKQSGFAGIDLDRQVTLEQLREAEQTQFSGLDSSIAAAVSGINEDVFQRLGRLDEDVRLGLQDIESLSQQALEQVVEVIAPRTGFRPGDSPITDRAFRIAGEQVKAGGRVISGAQRTARDISQTAGRQIGDIRSEAERTRGGIAGRFSAARNLTETQANALRAQTSGQLEAAGAEARLELPFRADELAIRGGLEGARTIGQQQQAAQELGLSQEELQIARDRGDTSQLLGLETAIAGISEATQASIASNREFALNLSNEQEARGERIDLTRAGVTSQIAGGVTAEQQATENFQARLEQQAVQNRLALTGTIGNLGLGLAGTGGTSATGTLDALTDARIAGTGETRTTRTTTSPLQIAASILGSATGTGG